MKMNTALQGYQGLVDGGDNIKLAHWHSVTNIIQQVGKNLSILLYEPYWQQRWGV